MKKLLCGIFFVLLLTTIVAQETKNSVKINTLAKTSMSWDGSTLPNYIEGKPEVTILKITIPPNTTLPLHKHPVINAGVLLSGELTIVTEENKTLHLKSGDAIVEVVNKWHYGKNEGDIPTEIIVFYVGTQGIPLTITK